MVVSGMVVSAIASVFTGSSPSAVFSMINNLQLMLLLPMVAEYVSNTVKSLILGTSFAILSFDFIDIDKIRFVNDLTNWMSYPQSDEYLNDLGFRSGSAIINYLPLMATIILIGLIHLLVTCCYSCSKQKKESSKCRKPSDFLFKMFTFNIYIRLILEGYVFILVSTLTELSKTNFETTPTVVSFIL